MNPYLESPNAWRDFHESFLPRMRDVLNETLGENYFIRIEENLYIRHPLDDGKQLFAVADAAVMTPAITQPFESRFASSAAVMTAPVQVAIPISMETDSEIYLEIVEMHRDQVVTVIELLSPSNKSAGENRRAYLLKRERILASDAHLVEIDLLRGGERLPVEDLPRCDYYALVSRADARPVADLWPLALRDRLPVIPIPLNPPDADILLDLQSLLDQVYDAAGYAKHIYRHSPQPRLSANDSKWAEEIIDKLTHNRS
jgi:hypothetical protein